MKAGSGKAKGTEFERSVCKSLSRWVSRGEREDLFWRSSISGGRATRRRQKGEDVQVQLGDICAVDVAGHPLTDIFYIECKFYKDLQLASFLLKDKGSLFDFWKKTKEEAAYYNRIPMLISKQNRYPTFVLLPSPNSWNDRSTFFRYRFKFSGANGGFLVLFDDLLSGPPLVRT